MARCLSPCSSRPSAWRICRIRGESAGELAFCARTPPAANSATESRTAQVRFAGQESVIACSRPQQNNNDPCERQRALRSLTHAEHRERQAWQRDAYFAADKFR
jgi:hypothetical protein